MNGRIYDPLLGRMLVDAVHAHKLAWVAAVDARYAGLLTRGPWVASITIARLDKAGSAGA